MTVLPSCSFKQNDIIYQDNSDITVDKFEITLNLHHIGQKSGIYSGKMKDDLPNGKGSFETQNKYGTTVIYEGEWVNGQLEGQGTIIWTGDEAMSLEGNFVDSDIVKGKEFYDGVMVYDGEWKNLTYHGHGTFYNSSGDAIYSGSFENGLPSDKDKFIAAAKDVSYDELLNNPMHYIFDIIKVQGKIVYVWEGEDDYCEYMISTDESDEQTVYISYFRRSKDERHIQEGDSLTVYGISSGLYSYETTQDAIATTPNMTMFYFE
jgi:hypothetical protein